MSSSAPAVDSEADMDDLSLFSSLFGDDGDSASAASANTSKSKKIQKPVKQWVYMPHFGLGSIEIPVIPEPESEPESADASSKDGSAAVSEPVKEENKTAIPPLPPASFHSLGKSYSPTLSVMYDRIPVKIRVLTNFAKEIEANPKNAGKLAANKAKEKEKDKEKDKKTVNAPKKVDKEKDNVGSSKLVSLENLLSVNESANSPAKENNQNNNNVADAAVPEAPPMSPHTPAAAAAAAGSAKVSSSSSDSSDSDSQSLYPPYEHYFLVHLNSSVRSQLHDPLIKLYSKYNIELNEDELRFIHWGRELLMENSNLLECIGDIKGLRESQELAPETMLSEGKKGDQDNTVDDNTNPLKPWNLPRPTIYPHIFPLICVFDRASKFVFDPNDAPMSYLILSNEGKTVRLNSDSSRWCSIHTVEPVVKGRVFFKVHFGQCQGNSFVGVMTSQSKTSNYCGHDAHSYGAYGCSGVFHLGNNTSYGTTYRSGDTVTCFLDMDKRTIGFKINDQDFGVAFRQLPAEVFPAVSLYTKDDHCTLVDFGTW